MMASTSRRTGSKLLLGLLAFTALPLLTFADKDGSGGNGGLPIEDLDEEAYLGTWFQAYGSASVLYTFELGGNCVTATYSATEADDKIKVQNRVRPFAKHFDDEKRDHKNSWLRDCSVLLVEGFAAQSNETDGAFTVKLAPGPLPFELGVPDINDVEFEPSGNYWILELGPILYDQYQWAIVSNGKAKTQLYVLVRNVAMFEELYEEEVLHKVKEYGFTTFSNRPRKSNQDDCGYEYEDIFRNYQMFWDESVMLDDDEYYHDDKYDDEKHL